MNYKFMSLIFALLLGCGCAMAQDYEDDIYYDGKTEPAKPKVIEKRQQTVTSGSVVPTPPVYGVVNGRDVDEYNRRIDGYYNEDDTVILDDDVFANTRRIEKFYNPDIVIRSNDPDLIEYYFESTPQVNLIVGTDWNWGPSWGWGWRSAYYDPWYSWGWGWYSPWYYSSWYDWGWYGGYRYHPWSYWGRPWGGYWGGYWGGSHWGRPYHWDNGWYGHHYNSGYNGRRPGMNYHGNRGNTGNVLNHGTAAAPGRNGGRYGNAGGYANHGNIGNATTSGNGYNGRTTMQPGGRSAHGNSGRSSSGTYRNISSIKFCSSLLLTSMECMEGLFQTPR